MDYLERLNLEIKYFQNNQDPRLYQLLQKYEQSKTSKTQRAQVFTLRSAANERFQMNPKDMVPIVYPTEMNVD